MERYLDTPSGAGMLGSVNATGAKWVGKFWYVAVGLIVVLIIIMIALSATISKQEGINSTATLRYVVSEAATDKQRDASYFATNVQESTGLNVNATAEQVLASDIYGCSTPSTLKSTDAFAYMAESAASGETAVGSRAGQAKTDAELSRKLIGM